jgi:hypothetical protein
MIPFLTDNFSSPLHITLGSVRRSSSKVSSLISLTSGGIASGSMLLEVAKFHFYLHLLYTNLVDVFHCRSIGDSI